MILERYEIRHFPQSVTIICISRPTTTKKYVSYVHVCYTHDTVYGPHRIDRAGIQPKSHAIHVSFYSFLRIHQRNDALVHNAAHPPNLCRTYIQFSLLVVISKPRAPITEREL